MSKPNRRKGNAKNASSSAAHQLLANGGSSFVGLAPEMNIFEVGNNMEEPITQVDDEARIILRKLIKKDPSTREKGLRELMEYLNCTNESIESCYEHFYGIVEQLATDGSPTVRMLTMKTVGMFVEKLRKNASKGLKKIVPAIFFSMHDVSNSVRTAARSAFVDNFPKKQETVEVFGRLSYKLAVEILKGTHDLCLPAKYDAEETAEQRKYRLEDQAMKMIEGFLTSTNFDLGNELVMTIFESKESVKRILGCQEPKIKQSFIALCIAIPDNFEVLLNAQIYQFIMSSLDSETGNICEIAWKAFTKMLKNAKFYEKVSFEKTILPKILFVIRQKKAHWIQMGNYLAEALKGIVDNLPIESKVLMSILESFLDNLGSDTFGELAERQWARSYKDINEMIMRNEHHSQIDKEFVTNTVKMCEEAVKMKNSAAQASMAEMIEHFVEHEWLNREEQTKLIQLLEYHLVGEKYDISSFSEPLLKSGKLTQLCSFHAALFHETGKTDRYVMKILLESDENYFRKMFERLGSAKFLTPFEKWTSADSDVIVGIVLRIFDMNIEKYLDCSRLDSNNLISRRLLLSCEKFPQIWAVVFTKFKNATFQDMIEDWQKEQNGKAIRCAYNELNKHKIPFTVDWSIFDLKCIAEIIESNDEIDSKHLANLGTKLFVKILESEDLPETRHYEILGNVNFEHSIRSELIGSIIQTGINRIRGIASRLDKILEHSREQIRNDICQNCLINEENVRQLVDEFATFEVETLVYSDSVFNEGTSYMETIPSINIDTFADRLIELGKIALFNVSINDPTESAIKYIKILQSIIQSCRLRFPFRNLDTIFEEILAEIESLTKLKNERIFDIKTDYCNGFAMDAIPIEKNLTLLDSSQDLKRNSKLIKIYFDEDDMKFIDFVKDGGDGEGQLLDPFDIQRNGNPIESFETFLFARKSLKITRNIEKYLEKYSEQLEYILCGIVTVLDALYDQTRNTGFKKTRSFELYSSIYLRAFAHLEQQFRGLESDSNIVEEWKGFYSPTISKLVLNFLGLVKKDDIQSSFANSILVAVEQIEEFPADFEECPLLENTFAPELEAFKYSRVEQSIIAHSFSLIDSKYPAVQLIGLKVLKLMLPKMLEIENEDIFCKKNKDDSNLTEENKSRIKLPVLITQKLDELNESWNIGVIFLLDLCITPLEKLSILPDNEARIAYSDVLWNVLKQCLPVLLTYVPTYLARSKVEEYYLQTDSCPSPVFIEKYASRLLFRTISWLPASVRLWFRGLPGNVANSLKSEITKDASRLLIEHELAKIRNSKYTTAPDEQDLKIRAVLASCEIITEYVVEETKMRLTITFPPDYPLSVPTLDLDKAIVKSDKARKWLLQLNAYLFHQNGTITEGLEMWKSNVDKGVEGAEACTICMMTIHLSTHQLPKVKCKQCKNKFHSNCLYKWFETSNQSSCPLCRANFT